MTTGVIMSDDGRSTAVLEQVQEAAQQQTRQAGTSPASVHIRHVSHFHYAGRPQQTPAFQRTQVQPMQQGIFVPQRVYRGGIAALVVLIAAAGVLGGLLASRFVYPQPPPQVIWLHDERPAQEALWQHAFAQAAVQSSRALREAPGSVDAIRAHEALELALTQQDEFPWQAILSAAHSAKSAEAAVTVAADSSP